MGCGASTVTHDHSGTLDAVSVEQPTLPAGEQVLTTQSAGFALDGHPLEKFNGVYLQFSENRGQPMLRNERAGTFCYYHTSAKIRGRWVLHRKCDPDHGSGHSYIAAPNSAPLPVGTQSWRYHQPASKAWKECMATVTVFASSAAVEAYRQRAIERIEGAARARSATPQEVVDAVQKATANLDVIEIGDGRVRLYKGTDPAPAITAKLSEIGALFVDPEFNVESPLTAAAAVYGFPFSVPADAPPNAWDAKHQEKLQGVRHLRVCHRADFVFDGVAQSEPFVIFDDSASAHDIHQGCMSNCWMLARFAAFAHELPALLGLTFGQCASVSAVGCYSVRLFVDGEPVYMLLDDYILSKQNGEAVGVKSNDPVELWPRLLEKAFAKLGGSYLSLRGTTDGKALRKASYGRFGDVMQLLSGMPGHVREAWDRSQDSLTEMEAKLDRIRASHGIAVAACDVGNPRTDGLSDNHCFSVLWCGEVAGQHFVCLRNPWGHCEWNGKWSDNASEWETERGQSVKKALLATGLFQVGQEIKAPAFRDPHHTPNANDGAFIMDTADFFHHFNSVNCCFPIEFSFGRGTHTEYMLKLDAENAAADMEAAALAVEQLEFGFTLSGHPCSEYNGTYRNISKFNGWPVMQIRSADNNVFCYHYSDGNGKQRWQLNKANTPEKGACFSFIRTTRGAVGSLLPTGTQTWTVHHDGCWNDLALTVTTEET